MSPDDIDIQQDGSNSNSTSEQLFSLAKEQQEPFATINLERKATRKMAAMSTAHLYGEHGQV